MIEYLKTFLEALSMKPKTKFVGVIFGIVLLCLKPFLIQYNMKWFYNKFSWIIILITLFFAASLTIEVIVEVYEWGRNKYNKRKVERDYEKYILGLSDKKLAIVKKLYANEHHQGYLRQNDTNVIELVNMYVIMQLNNEIIVRESQVEDINDPEFIFVLQPPALHIIEKNSEKFK